MTTKKAPPNVAEMVKGLQALVADDPETVDPAEVKRLAALVSKLSDATYDRLNRAENVAGALERIEAGLNELADAVGRRR